MIEKEFMLLNKNEINPSFDSNEDLGKIILDEQHVHLISNLIQLYVSEDTDKNILKILSRKITTYGYESNINYNSMCTIFEKNNLSISILNKVYIYYEINKSIFNLSKLIIDHKKSLHIGKGELINFDNKIKTTLYLTNRNSYPSCRLLNKENVSLISTEGKVLTFTYKDEEKTQHFQDKDPLSCCLVKVEVYTN